ncbi:MAG: hypothetical protein ABFD69_01420 [Candidatus Sumerlaeia bacterium]
MVRLIHMNEMAATLQQHDRLSFTERSGGWVLAVCLHIILFAGLVIIKPPVPSASTSPPETIQITFAAEAPEPAADPVPQVAGQKNATEPAASTPAAVAAPAEAARPQYEPATTLGSEAGNADSGPESGEAKADAREAAADAEVEQFLSKNYMPAAEPAATAEPVAGSVPATTSDPNVPAAGTGESAETARLVGTLRERSEEMNRQNEAARQQGSAEVAARIMQAHAVQTADKTLFAANPMHTGVVRSIETSDVPNQVADEVLVRWGFRTQLMQLGANQHMRGGYLSNADTAAGNFVNATEQAGVYRVLMFSDNTVRRLIRLEDDEMRRRNHDPAKFHIKAVTFGIVPTGSGYDLAVTKMEVEPIKAAPEPASRTDGAVRRVQ